ncbi:hypothetical protein TG4357_00202 [Thalassovita gelatinovora]|uniref:Uncharacterized protein n=1 Tax=Thalassovita gelatinovora TaxID=53501 RepID=A0A0P1FNB8_THAGE|nr:hypothetical protein [Thalassovita gelatinovora]QIZ79340.1 hypothetical protein HFZ77_02055 [Thalassovita gelatinovora]CUH62605.1 hypothetical protein TG4357_00202 [Thalassovita gelatinovora]SEQ07174.1 hypothetical protein SAMN04488043_103102 [Thalassovita gelatinovora]
MKRPAPLHVLWEHHKPTMILLGLALVLAVFFTVRFTLHWVYWQDHRNLRPDIEPWMTVGYVAHAWHTPALDLATLLGQPEDIRRKTLEEIAHEQNRPVAELIAELNAVLEKVAQ